MPHSLKGGGAYDGVTSRDPITKTDERSNIMKQRFFYGGQPNIQGFDPKEFSRGQYECTNLFKSRSDCLVLVSHHKIRDIWKVEYGLSSVFFGTKAEALAYCKGLCADADGIEE